MSKGRKATYRDKTVIYGAENLTQRLTCRDYGVSRGVRQMLTLRFESCLLILRQSTPDLQVEHRLIIHSECMVIARFQYYWALASYVFPFFSVSCSISLCNVIKCVTKDEKMIVRR